MNTKCTFILFSLLGSFCLSVKIFMRCTLYPAHLKVVQCPCRVNINMKKLFLSSLILGYLPTLCPRTPHPCIPESVPSPGIHPMPLDGGDGAELLLLRTEVDLPLQAQVVPGPRDKMFVRRRQGCESRRQTFSSITRPTFREI